MFGLVVLGSDEEEELDELLFSFDELLSCFAIDYVFGHMLHNVLVYGKLRVYGRGFSKGKSEAGKHATNFVLAKTSNYFYMVL